MQFALLLLILLAYGFARELMPESAWTQAPNLKDYLLGALLGPAMDALAFVGLALFALANLPRARWLRWTFAGVVTVVGLLTALMEAAPVLQDVRDSKRVEAEVLAKRPDQIIDVKTLESGATASFYLPNVEQYERVPLRIPVEFRVAPHVGVAHVVGVLE